MKQSYGKFLIALAMPVIVAAVPSVTYATCTNGVPDGPPTWDPSVTVPKTARIGDGTDIGPNVTIGGYAIIGACGQIGLDGQGVALGMRSKVGQNGVITGQSKVGYRSKVYGNVTLNSTLINGNSVVGAGSIISNTAIASHVQIGGNSNISDSKFGTYATTGGGSQITGSVIGYQSTSGAGVIVDTGSKVGRYARIDPSVHLYHDVTVGYKAHVCSDVNPGMTIARYSNFGC